ncbi:MAG: hypothetical protein WBP26_05085 [Candidatus Saccharimonadales bacterium]
MAKKIPVPAIEYVQVEEPNTDVVEKAFDLLFEMVVAANETEVVYPSEEQQ